MSRQLRVYIWTDIEGLSGIIGWDNFGDTTPAYLAWRARMGRLLTGEVNAAVEGACEAGATEVLVKDSHGTGDNLDVESLHARADLIAGCKGLPHPWAGIDGGFDAAVIIGAHPMEGTENGILPHTIYEINGVRMGDAGLFAAIAASMGVPTVFASGDGAAMDQLKSWAPDMRVLAVKRAFGPYAARMVAPVRARELTRDGVRQALHQRGSVRPMDLGRPYRVAFDGKQAEGDNLLETFMRLYDPQRAIFGNASLEPELAGHKRSIAAWLRRFEDGKQEKT